MSPARGGPRAVLVDQFEETFTLGASPDDQVQFIDRLLALSREPETCVVLAVRADHLGQCAAHPALAAQLAGNDVLVGPMRDSELRRTVELPARRAGLEIEAGLVEVIVGDVAGRAGALPLLSTALAETWERRESRRLTLAGYRAAGGVNGALARLAEDGYAAIPAPARPAARQILLRLCDVGDDANSTCDAASRCPRSSTTTTSTAGPHSMRSPIGGCSPSTATPSRWPTSRSSGSGPACAAGWRRTSRAGALHRRLGDATRAWEADGRDPSELYRGTQLHATAEWADGHADALNRLEREFLDDSQEAADAQRRAARRRRRTLVSVLAGAAAVATALGSFAALQADRATDQRDRALAAEGSAQIGTLVNRSLALRSTDRAAAALLAVEAHRRAPGDAGVHSALLGTFTGAPGFMGYIHLPGDPRRLSGDVVPASSTAVVALEGRDLHLLDLDSGELEERFPSLDDTGIVPEIPTFSVVRVSTDGRLVAHLVPTEADHPCLDLDVLRATDNAGCAALLVYDVASGDRVLGPVAPPVGPGDVAISADGSLVAVAGGYDGKVVVYRTDDGETIGSLPGVPRPDGVLNRRDTAAVAFGADGRLYTGSLAGAIRVVDPTTMEIVDRYDGPPMAAHNNLRVTGEGLVVGSGDDNVVAIDAETGTVRWAADVRVPGDFNPCLFLGVAEPMGRFYCGNIGGVLDERDLATGARTGFRLDPQLGSVGELSMASDGRELVAFGEDVGVVSRWRLDGSGPIVDVAWPGWGSNGYDPSGQLLLAFEGQRETLNDLGDLPPPDFFVWDPATGEVVHDLDGIQAATWMTPVRVGAVFDDGTPGFYDLGRDDRLASPGARHATVAGAWLSAGGARTYVLGNRGDESNPRCEIWAVDVDTIEYVGPTIEVDQCEHETFNTVSTTPDASRLAFTYVSREHDGWATNIYDGRTGELLGALQGLTIAVISPDGTLVGAGTTGEVTQYDLETLEPIGAFPGARRLRRLPPVQHRRATPSRRVVQPEPLDLRRHHPQPARRPDRDRSDCRRRQRRALAAPGRQDGGRERPRGPRRLEPRTRPPR